MKRLFIIAVLLLSISITAQERRITNYYNTITTETTKTGVTEIATANLEVTYDNYFEEIRVKRDGILIIRITQIVLHTNGDTHMFTGKNYYNNKKNEGVFNPNQFIILRHKHKISITQGP